MGTYKRPPLYKRIYNKIVDAIKSTILCIRFPFLYPRNRFSGHHYHNYKLISLMNDYWKKAYSIDAVEDEDGNIHIHKALTSRLHLCLYYVIKFWYEYICQLIFCIPTYTELDAMPLGWRKALGIQMCKEIKQALIKHGGYKELYQYRILQIKEKWGTLRWYDAMAPKSVHDIIKIYEALSYHVCINCGSNAVWHTTGYILPLCDNCISNKERERAQLITT